jgi:hypothetical protein
MGSLPYSLLSQGIRVTFWRAEIDGARVVRMKRYTVVHSRSSETALSGAACVGRPLFKRKNKDVQPE